MQASAAARQWREIASQALLDSAPVTLYALEVIDYGNAKTGQRVQDGQHNDVQAELTKQRLHSRHIFCCDADAALCGRAGAAGATFMR